MDLKLAIDRNREALLEVLAALFAMVGMVANQAALTLPRSVYLAALRQLRPAESATRRLIAALAQEFEAPAISARAAPKGAIPRGSNVQTPSFALFDPRKRLIIIGASIASKKRGAGPQIRVLGMEVANAGVTAHQPTKAVDTAQLCRRLQALQSALNDLPRQARRLSRIISRRKHLPLGAGYKRAMRPGRPPGHRSRPIYAVDQILRDCHEFALYALRPPDTV